MVADVWVIRADVRVILTLTLTLVKCSVWGRGMLLVMLRMMLRMMLRVAAS